MVWPEKEEEEGVGLLCGVGKVDRWWMMKGDKRMVGNLEWDEDVEGYGS